MTEEDIETCINCGCELTQSEIETGEGWCSDCNLPERGLEYE